MLPFIIKKSRSEIKNDSSVIESKLKELLNLDSSIKEKINDEKINIENLAFIYSNTQKLNNFKPYAKTHFLNVLKNAKLESLDFIEKHFRTIFSWINSNEFYEKYEVKAHPYPAFLNPDVLNFKITENNKNTNNTNENLENNLDSRINKNQNNKLDSTKNENLEKAYKEYEKENLTYELIGASVAWDLNIPLPKVYKYVFYALGATAHWTIVEFLERILGISYNQIDYHHFLKSQDISNFYKIENKDLFIYNRWYIRYEESNYKFQYLAADIPYIILVRDPISRLRTIINHGVSKPNHIFKLHDNIKQVIARDYYVDCLTYEQYNTPSTLLINSYIKMSQVMNYDYTTTANICNKEVHYIEMTDFSPENIIENLPKYAKFFDKELNQNKVEQEKEYLQEKKWSLLSLILPLSMNIPLESKTLKMQITYKQQVPNNLKDYINEFSESKLEIINLIAFGMSENDFNELKNNENLFKETKEYLEQFIIEFDRYRIEQENARLSQKQILDYLKENKESALKFKNLLDKELKHIKQARPDIVDSWNYYKEFENICDEFK